MAKLNLKIKNPVVSKLTEAILENRNFNPIDAETGLPRYEGIDLISAYIEQHLTELLEQQIVKTERQEMRARIKKQKETLSIIDTAADVKPADPVVEPGPEINPGVTP